MMRQDKPITILMADDDADDRQMTREAFEQARVANDLRFVIQAKGRYWLGIMELPRGYEGEQHA